MLCIKVFPPEIRVLIGFLRVCTGDILHVSLANQPLTVLVLRKYLESWNAQRLLAWRTRNPKKAYKLRMELTVAKALYQELQASGLTHYEQDLLGRLDEAIVNYRHPLSEPYLLGDLSAMPDNPIHKLIKPLSQ